MDDFITALPSNHTQYGVSFIPYMTDTPAPPNNNSYCNYYRPKNSNTTIIIYGGYEGIPQNLCINVIAWLGLILLFSILRKNAWNYGRMALLQRRERRESSVGNNGYNVWTQLFYGVEESDHGLSGSYDPGTHLDQGMFSWISAVFRIKDEQIRSKCGSDAVQYLAFQKYVITLTSIVMVLALSVALPINFQGNLMGDETQFGHTTLTNLDPGSWFVWIHVGLSILFVPIAIYLMRRFSVKLNVPETESTISRTLMISHIPRRRCNKVDLLKHFNEAYPEYEVADIQIAYDVKQLMELDEERRFALQARVYSESEAKSGIRLQVRPYACGKVCICCDVCGGSVIDAVEYYTVEERRLACLLDEEKIKAIQHPVGVAFVTFASKLQASNIRRDHRPGWRCGTNAGHSSLSLVLKPHRWTVDFAPRPDDINWQNLSMRSRFWYLRSCLINTCLFVLLFFMTTPTVILSVFDKVQLTSSLEKMSPVISQFVPTLILWITTALLPFLVAYSDEWMGHWTKSMANHTVMRKTFIFLLFMVVILPSLGLTSAQAFFEWAFLVNETYRWECIFLPDNGAFFVNYVITSSFIGTALELMRFAGLFMYACKLCCAKSKAEAPGIRRSLLLDFNFGVQYAWMLLIFSLIIMYSISCPLITPFGLVYMLLKHFVDRYNIFFAYAPSRINKRIHTTAINFVITAFVILQLTLFFFSYIRNGLKGVTIFSLVGFSIILFLVVAQAFLRWFQMLAPISYRVSRNTKDDHAPAENNTTLPEVAALMLKDAADLHFRFSNEGSGEECRGRVDGSSVGNDTAQGRTFLPEVLTETSSNGPPKPLETLTNGGGAETQASSSTPGVTTSDNPEAASTAIKPVDGVEKMYSYQMYNDEV